MTKSLNKGNAQTGAVLDGRGATSAMTRDGARPVLDLGHGRPEEHGLTSETDHHLIAEPGGNRCTARWVPEQGSGVCLNGGSDAHPTRGR
jgi:hypothetical protein